MIDAFSSCQNVHIGIDHPAYRHESRLEDISRAALSAAGGKSMLSALERQGVKGSDDRRVSVAALDSQPLAASSLKKPSRRQALASVLAVASVPERLSGTRAWVKQTGRKPASHGQAINADLGARMKSDPFDRLRAEVERLQKRRDGITAQLSSLADIVSGFGKEEPADDAASSEAAQDDRS